MGKREEDEGRKGKREEGWGEREGIL